MEKPAMLQRMVSRFLARKKISVSFSKSNTDFVVLFILALSLFVVLPAGAADFDEEYEVKAWKEIVVTLPPSPIQSDLVQFYVSAATDNSFFIDASTISVGEDGVVRYVLVIQAGGGARNVSYEGIRCQTREHRIYASGRRDGSWSKSRNNEWAKIQEVYANRYNAALFMDYFCPDGTLVRSADEARRALRSGGNRDLILGR